MAERENSLPSRKTDSNDATYPEVSTLLKIAAHGAPPLDQDPVAAMLGLIPDPACQIGSRQLSTARKKAGIKSSDLAQRLRSRGWDFGTNEVFRWETQDSAAAAVPPAVVQSIASTLGVSVSSLIGEPSKQMPDTRIETVKRDGRFRALAVRWSQARSISLEAAIAALESRMVATVHRGEKPEPEKLLASLEALVTAVEETPDR